MTFTCVVSVNGGFGYDMVFGEVWCLLDESMYLAHFDGIVYIDGMVYVD